jgi:uncharacterized protein
MSDAFIKRTYRAKVTTEDLVSFRVVEKESDLFILSPRNLEREAREALKKGREILEHAIEQNPGFLTSLNPLPHDPDAPPLIQAMLAAGMAANVGPMASVAGALAEYVGRYLLDHCAEVIVENGGDIFLASHRERFVRIFTSNPHFGDRLRIRVRREAFPLSICTSSGIIGPSLSFGRADAATIVSHSGSLADAAATALGNMVKSEAHIPEAIEKIKNLEGVKGIIAIIGEKVGIWGDVELVTP